ncbi:MAG: EamA family transporter [Acidobacteriaceae bacterium]
MRQTRSTAALFAVLALIWGSEWMLADSLRGSPPLATGSLRCLAAGAVLLPFAWRARRTLIGNSDGAISLSSNVLIGAGLIAVPEILLILAGTHAGFGDRSAIFAAVPLLVASCRARTRGLQAFCLAGLTGIALFVAAALSLSWRTLPSLLAAVAAALVTAGALLFAEAVWERAPAVGSVSHTQPNQQPSKMSIPSISIPAAVCVQLLAAAAVLATASLALERRMGSWPMISWPMISWQPGSDWALALGAAATCGGYLLFFSLLRVLPAAKLAAVFWGQTLVAAGEAAWLFRQRLDWQMLLGAAVILGSLVLLLRAPDAADSDSDPLILRITGGP